MWFQKLSILPHGRSLEIPRGRGGGLKAKLLEGQYEAKLEFPGGCGGAKQKKPSMGGVWIFSGTTQCTFRILHIWLPSQPTHTLRMNWLQFFSNAVHVAGYSAILPPLQYSECKQWMKT